MTHCGENFFLPFPRDRLGITHNLVHRSLVFEPARIMSHDTYSSNMDIQLTDDVESLGVNGHGADVRCAQVDDWALALVFSAWQLIPYHRPFGSWTSSTMSTTHLQRETRVVLDLRQQKQVRQEDDVDVVNLVPIANFDTPCAW